VCYAPCDLLLTEYMLCVLSNVYPVKINFTWGVDLTLLFSAAVSYAVQRGEKMAKKQGYRLESEVI